MCVADVMDREPVAIPGEISVERALDEYFLRYRWPWFPVVDAAHSFLGLLERDRADEVPEITRASSHIAELVDHDRGLFVRDDTPLDALLTNQNLRRLGALMAVDAEGRLSGVITSSRSAAHYGTPPPPRTSTPKAAHPRRGRTPAAELSVPMSGKVPRGVERARLAKRQHGVVSIRQLRALGYSEGVSRRGCERAAFTAFTRACTRWGTRISPSMDGAWGRCWGAPGGAAQSLVGGLALGPDPYPAWSRSTSRLRCGEAPGR